MMHFREYFFPPRIHELFFYILYLILLELIRINNRKDFKKKIREFVAEKHKTKYKTNAST